MSKSFGEKVIVKNFTATILRGDKVGWSGPTALGKTTLLKLGSRRTGAGIAG